GDRRSPAVSPFVLKQADGGRAGRAGLHAPPTLARSAGRVETERQREVRRQLSSGPTGVPAGRSRRCASVGPPCVKRWSGRGALVHFRCRLSRAVPCGPQRGEAPPSMGGAGGKEVRREREGVRGRLGWHAPGWGATWEPGRRQCLAVDSCVSW